MSTILIRQTSSTANSSQQQASIRNKNGSSNNATDRSTSSLSLSMSGSDLQTMQSLGRAAEQRSTKSFTNFFGKKNKNPQENSTCLLACAINFFKTPESKSSEQKLQKYLTRCKSIISSSNGATTDLKQESAQMISAATSIANCQYLHIAVHNLLMNAPLLPFESKKDVYCILVNSLKLSEACVGYFVVHAPMITQFLLSKFESHEMSFFAGNVLRIFLKQQDLMPVILDMQFLERIIQSGKNTVFEVSSEALETFHVIFKQRKNSDKKTLSDFLVDNHESILRMFFDMAETENYLAKRDILLTLTTILTDPSHQKFMLHFINDQVKLNHLKSVMNILSESEQGGFKEVTVILLETFLINFAKIDSEKVRTILSRNKQQLIQCISNCKQEDSQNGGNNNNSVDKSKQTSLEIEQRNQYLIHILESL